MSKVRVDQIANLNGDFVINTIDLVKATRTVASMAELRGLVGDRDGQAIYMISYYPNIQRSGSGVFIWRATSTLTENKGTVVNPNISTSTPNAAGRWIRNTESAPTNPLWFGAVGDGVTDDTIAIQASVTWAQDNGNEWYLPAGRYLTSSTILQTNKLKAWGAGRGNSVIIYNGSQQGWFAQPPVASSGNNRFWTWTHFSILPAAAQSGTYGLQINLKTGCFLSNFTVAEMEFGLFGTRGFYLDNSIGNTDGFFVGLIWHCWIQNGIAGDKIGDNMTFHQCTVTGKNDIRLSGVPGARQVILSEMNVSTTGGLVSLLDIGEPTLRDCQLEHSGAYTGIFDCVVYLHNCINPLIDSCTINPNVSGSTNVPSSTIGIDGTTTNPRIIGNDINKATSYHVNIASSVVGGWLDPSNTYYSGAASINNQTGSTFKGQIFYARPYGTVSIVGGGNTAPSGDIIESGSNSNGFYTKFADGTMICRQSLSITWAANASAGVTWTFPVAFASAPSIMTNVATATPHLYNSSFGTVAPASVPIYAGGSTSAAGLVHAEAIGRWY